MSKLPTGGYQPTNRPENLTLPNKGPSYKPKEEKTKIIWHPYPQEKPKIDDEYIVSIKLGKDSFTATAIWKNVKDEFQDVFNENITAWADMPEPYKEKNK